MLIIGVEAVLTRGDSIDDERKCGSHSKGRRQRKTRRRGKEFLMNLNQVLNFFPCKVMHFSMSNELVHEAIHFATNRSHYFSLVSFLPALASSILNIFSLVIK